MNKVKKIRYYLKSLCVYNFSEDKLFSAIDELLESVGSEAVIEKQSAFYRLLAKHGSLKKYIAAAILANDNAFTEGACFEGGVDSDMLEAVKGDLEKLEAIASLTAQDIIDITEDANIREILYTIPEWACDADTVPLTSPWCDCTDKLIEYHKNNGYGKYARHIAFTWRDKEIVPIEYVDPITLADLKNYEEQRQRVIDNTEGFIDGHPANNVLLYGDRGTGKSSTVHALLNEYHGKGLRMIEIPKSAVAELSLIREAISGSPMKFIIYIDDLSFDSNDSSFGELKAALEGSLSGKRTNTLIYATSNRRHLIRESFSDRENDINRNDIMQEQLSLSDRFGLTITFLNPNKFDYLDIVEKIAADRGLELNRDELHLKAERWATRRGGRSPRCAKQFVDYVESCVNRGKEW